MGGGAYKMTSILNTSTRIIGKEYSTCNATYLCIIRYTDSNLTRVRLAAKGWRWEVDMYDQDFEEWARLSPHHCGATTGVAPPGSSTWFIKYGCRQTQETGKTRGGCFSLACRVRCVGANAYYLLEYYEYPGGTKLDPKTSLVKETLVWTTRFTPEIRY